MRQRTLFFLLIAGSTALAQSEETSQPRAKPPAEWPRDVREVFFDDARQQLVGSRPNYGEMARTPVAGTGASPTTTGGDSSYAWSKLADADVIETEIKRQLPALQPLVATPAAFKGGGYQECRNRFIWLATLFSIAGDYDDDVRWKDSAEGLGQLYARAGANCKVGTDQSFREAQMRVEDLAELVQGGRPDVPAAKPDVGWDQLTDRTPLMKRMEMSLGEGISPKASDKRSLSANSEDIHHEAQLMALMAEVILQPGIDYADEETYRQHGTQLRDASVALSQAVDLESFDAARAAIGNMQKACSNCHDEWR